MTRHSPEIILIAAMAANRVIGRGNRIPWHLPPDLARFRRLTMGHTLIMGRRTFESIGHPLDGRRNIVLSRSGSFRPPGVDVAPSLDSGIALAASAKKIFIIGGEQVYGAAISFADTLLLTILEIQVTGDTWFPHFEESEFVLRCTENHLHPIPYRTETWTRKPG